jgi:group I intron endonuclease
VSYIIYKITCTVTGMQYVGMTRRPLMVRWKCHVARSKVPSYQGKNYHLANALTKYGASAFTVECVDTAATKQEAIAKEIALIAKFNTLTPNGYNHTTGGECGSGAQMQISHTKQAEAMRALWADPAYKERVSAALRASQTPEMIARRGAAIKAARNTEESKRKTAEQAHRQWSTPEGRMIMLKGIESQRDSEHRKNQVRAALRRPEVREKLSVATKAAWDRRKAKEAQS